MGKLAEKFFGERDLEVLGDSPDDVKNALAKDWFNQVDEQLGKLPTYCHDNMGMPSEENSASDPQQAVWFFRGQKDVSYAFNSTLYRELIKKSEKMSPTPKTPKDHERAMLRAEGAVLATAKENGIGRGLTALETLTLLQHHGSPTRLIDVTSDWRIALFFACESGDNSDGRVFLLKISPQRWKGIHKVKVGEDNPSQLVWQDYKKNFSDTSGANQKYPWLSGVWPVLLPFTDPRMIAQRGFFLVGGVPSLKGTTHLYTSKCKNCNEKLCECNGDSEYGRIGHALNTHELREVTSLAIRFGAKKGSITDFSDEEFKAWTALGYSIKVPKDFKSELREILKQQGVTEDSVYPPLRETNRLFKHVASEALLQKSNGSA